MAAKKPQTLPALRAELEKVLAVDPMLDDQSDLLLYQYTDAGGFVGIVQSRVIWATHALHLNDREELRLGERLVHEAAVAAASRIGGLGKPLLHNFVRAHKELPVSKVAPLFVASFSEQGDLLSQWRGYAAGGAGYSVGFSQLASADPNHSVEPSDLAGMLVRVQYDEERLRATMVDQLLRIGNAFLRFCASGAAARHREVLAPAAIGAMLRQMGSLVPRAKHEAFSEEQEWRLIAMPRKGSNVVLHRATPRGVVPYVQIPLDADDRFPLARVIVGPLQDPTTGVNGARSLLEAHGADPDMVTTSRAPYRG